MTEKKYYNLMGQNMGETFEEIHKNWLKCFSYYLKNLNVGFSKKAIKSLFYEFEMNNWKAMHKENSPEYANHTKEELIDSFKSECSYISDRMSYDRLFRAHWLFYRAFDNELSKVRFPNLYK